MHILPGWRGAFPNCSHELTDATYPEFDNPQLGLIVGSTLLLVSTVGEAVGDGEPI
ncbi:hypothetical protein [Nostoc sp.]|uniref:hypothetical protein n=1 Tax=Nostoc sp. TaxID=1180 RepID=UPI002FF3B451